MPPDCACFHAASGTSECGPQAVHIGMPAPDTCRHRRRMHPGGGWTLLQAFDEPCQGVQPGGEVLLSRHEVGHMLACADPLLPAAVNSSLLATLGCPGP
jgi:hypothetical protein